MTACPRSPGLFGVEDATCKAYKSKLERANDACDTCHIANIFDRNENGELKKDALAWKFNTLVLLCQRWTWSM
jgi:hypothetical protein